FESNDSLKELAMLQVTEDTLKEQIPSLVFQYENQVVIIFYKDSNKYPRFDSLFKKEIYRALDSLYAYLERYFGNNTVIGVGSLEHAPSFISTSYKKALKALNYNAFNPDQHVLFINDMEKSSTKADSLNLEKYESDLLSMVKLGTREQVADCINVLGDQIVSLNADELSSFVLELLVAFDQLAQSYGTTLAKIVGDGRNLFEEVGTIHNAAKARRWFTSLALTIRDQLSGQRQSSHIKFVEDAKRLIGQHYQEPGFGLDQVCDMTNVSPAYFSSVFKKEIGSSFVQYLTNARLARAKELLVKTENKTYEIATAVGFTEPNYFSFCFKRYEGISPSQYRHQNKDEKH
ncbi:MAG: helix-turn-helix domain-containing protein, partial [Sphaerochaetaceae bacterium]